MTDLPGWIARLIATALLAALVLGAALVGGFAPLDQGLRSLRFAGADRAPSGEVVFVDIDAQSLAAVGVWPWPRTVHAEVLDRLMALGAADVVFDIDFSTASTDAADAALEAALARAGGYAFLAAFQQPALDGSLVLNQPLPRFAAQADPVLVNVDGDGTGLLQSVPAALAEPPIPSVARALVPAAQAVGSRIVIDYGIDLALVPRISVADLLAGRVDPAELADRQVVIGASAVELRDLFLVPRFGVIPGPMVQIAATETLKAGRSLTDLGSAPAAMLGLAAAVLFALLGRRVAVPRLVLAGIAASLLLELMAWLALREGRLLVDTVAFHLLAGGLVLVGLVGEWLARQRENRRQQARLAWLARHDPLTGARSRQALLDDLGEAPGAIILVQLVRLDAITATLGHEIADAVAAEAVGRLATAAGELPARIGTDLLALAEPDDESVEALAGRLGAVLEAPYAVGGHRVILEARFGVGGAAAETAAERLRQAEVALDHARSGGVRLAHFLPEHGARIEQRRVLDLELRQALAEGQFFLLFQPQVDLATGATLGVEALVRWQHPTLGLVSPADFIPLAEETGLIVELGHWVLLEACRQAAGWTWDGRLSVNVSAAQFRLGDVVGSVEAALTASGFPAGRLDVEITESLFVDGDAGVVGALHGLQRLGARIALDDFGTGYSSLSYLSRLPIDKIKIDQSFVRALPDADSAVIVETVVLMAGRLGKTVIAEGVETEAQRRYLAGIGCPVGQGYLFGRPSTAEAIGLTATTAAA